MGICLLVKYGKSLGSAAFPGLSLAASDPTQATTTSLAQDFERLYLCISPPLAWLPVFYANSLEISRLSCLSR